jgi:hypothetical protein
MLWSLYNTLKSRETNYTNSRRIDRINTFGNRDPNVWRRDIELSQRATSKRRRARDVKNKLTGFERWINCRSDDAAGEIDAKGCGFGDYEAAYERQFRGFVVDGI